MIKPNKIHSSDKLFQLDDYPIFDEKNGIEKTNGETLLKEMLEIMLNDIFPEEISNLKIAQTTKNWDAIKKIAHKLKGGSVYCGTIRMTHACHYIERYKPNKQDQQLEKICGQLLTVIEQTEKATRIWLAKKSNIKS